MLLCFAIVFFVKLFANEYDDRSRQLDYSDSYYLRQAMDYAGAVSSSLGMSNEMCDFYLAESSIPRGGLGVFTSKPLTQGSPAQAWPDICVYLTDASSKRGTEIDTHTWQAFRFGAQWLGGARKEPRAACMGLVTIFNSMGMKKFASARPAAVPDLIHRNGGLDRYRDPGAGAITEFYGASSITLRDLEAGSELMLWDTGHGGDQYAADGRTELDVDLAPPPMRPPEWLQKHGMCADNIIVKTATDPSMGRGAFAKRYISAGSVIAPAPLQIFPNRAKFAAPNREDEDSGFEKEQLLVNYSFQPKGSTLLLYPYGPGVGLINHANPRSGKINAKLQWSKHHMNHGTQWLDSSLTLDQFWKMQYPGSLILEVVALRDIQKGEEIFIDYGSDWEAAWKKHVKSWKPQKVRKKIGKYAYPMDIFDEHNNPKKIIPYRTISEQETKPYPNNMMMACDTENQSDYREEERLKWRPSKHWPEKLVLCNILSRTYNAEADTYMYEIKLWPNMQHTRDEGTPINYVDYDVPHSAIRFVDKPFRSDQHMLNAFRHPIGFPEDMTPHFWRNQVPGM